METADPMMMAAAAQKYQEDCMVLVAQQVCNGRNVCGLETCPAYFRHLTSDEFEVPPSVCANLKSPRKKRFVSMLLGLFNLAHAKRYTDPTLKMLKKNVNTLRENQDQIHGDLAKLYRMVNLSKTELGEHRRLLHKLDENAVTLRIRMDRVFDLTPWVNYRGKLLGSIFLHLLKSNWEPFRTESISMSTWSPPCMTIFWLSALRLSPPLC